MDEVVLVKDLMDDRKNRGDVEDLVQPRTTEVSESHELVLKLMLREFDFCLEVFGFLGAALLVDFLQVLFVRVQVPFQSL